MAAFALKVLPPGPLAVHVDVDVLDFTDAPLAENTDGRSNGPTLEQLGEVLYLAARDPRFRALSIGEVNPIRGAGDPEVILRFERLLATTLGTEEGRVGRRGSPVPSGRTSVPPDRRGVPAGEGRRRHP